jgi:hypothetical protein
MNWNELPLEPRHLGVSLGAFKMISEPMVRLAQTVQLSCSDTDTVSEWTETRFHMSHVTTELHRMHPKLFPRLWNVRCIPYTYLASRLILSPNGSKWASTWASSPRRTIECVQNDFYVRWKPCTYLTLTLTPSPNRPKRDLTWPASPRRSIRCDQNDFWAYGMFGVNKAPILHQE